MTYNYTGYPMVRQAREMVRAGALGTIRKVVVEYNQGWLATPLEATGNKQADVAHRPGASAAPPAPWATSARTRSTSPRRSPASRRELCADLTAFVPGRPLDDDGSLLLRFEGGARGVLMASQIAVGYENDLRTARFRHEGCARLAAGAAERARAPPGRRAAPRCCAAARLASPRRRGARAACRPGIRRAISRRSRTSTSASRRTSRRGGRAAARSAGGRLSRVEDGARGVRFIEATVESARSDAKWYELPA